MRETTMTIKEFLNFRKEALQHQIEFLCHILPGNKYSVTADAEFLTLLGF